MRIIRYSINKFEPQYQSHHLKMVDNELSNFNIEEYPSHLQKFIMAQHEKLVPFYKENYNDFKYGIWAFIDGFKDNQSLNHLKKKVPCWRAEISDETTVYGVNWDEKFKITNDLCKLFGFFIPQRELHTLKLYK